MNFCAKCGTKIGDIMKFCPGCGADLNAMRTQYLSSEKKESTPVYEQQPYVQQPYVQQPYVQQPYVQQPYVQQPVPDTPERKMRRAYNKTGLGVLTLYGAMSVVSAVVLVAVAVIIAFASAVFNLSDFSFGYDVTGIVSDFSEISDTAGFLISLATAVGSAAGLAVGILLFRLIRGKKDIVPIEKKRLPAGEYLLFIVICFGLWGAGVILGNFQVFFILPELEFSNLPFWVMLPLDIYAVVGAPILEELAFRKVLLDGLHPYGENVAAFTSALLFGIIHGNSGQFFLAYMIGLLLAAIYQKTGKVGYTMGLHAIINFTATVPEYVGRFLGVDPEKFFLYEYVSICALGVIGIAVMFTQKNNKWLALSRPEVPNANKHAFKNPGMLIAVIAGTILLVIADATTLLSDFIAMTGSSFDRSDLIQLLKDAGLQSISTVGAILFIILTVTLVGRHQAKPKEEDTADAEMNY